MKRILILGMALVLALSLSGCATTDVGQEQQEGEMLQESVPLWGLILSAKDVTSTGMTLLINQSGGEVSGELQFGAPFWLEQPGEEGWEPVPFVPGGGEVAWNSLAYMIPMGESLEQEVTWELIYGELPAGAYRFGKEIMDFRGTGDYDQESFWAEFEVE